MLDTDSTQSHGALNQTRWFRKPHGVCCAERQTNCASWGHCEGRPSGYARGAGFVRKTGPQGVREKKSWVDQGVGVVLGEVMGSLLDQWVGVCVSREWPWMLVAGEIQGFCWFVLILKHLFCWYKSYSETLWETKNESDSEKQIVNGPTTDQNFRALISRAVHLCHRWLGRGAGPSPWRIHPTCQGAKWPWNWGSSSSSLSQDQLPLLHIPWKASSLHLPSSFFSSHIKPWPPCISTFIWLKHL